LEEADIGKTRRKPACRRNVWTLFKKKWAKVYNINHEMFGDRVKKRIAMLRKDKKA
jgi:hypothetical protein